MDRLVIQIQPPHAEQLRAHFDERTGLLSLTRPPAAGWPFGLDLGARLVMDFDSDWQLAGLDLLIPPTRWENGSLDLPARTSPGSLALNAMPMQRISLSLPLQVLSPRPDELQLFWGPSKPASRLTLSSQAEALLNGSLWVGLRLQAFR